MVSNESYCLKDEYLNTATRAYNKERMQKKKAYIFKVRFIIH